jgi:hypothetical protein
MKNDRKIVDLHTGVEMEQNRMLKLLLVRSQLKRNEWHEKAQQLVGRSLGSPTKLSDIFNGQFRSLPMRDIVPYIQALGMRKSETDYYIAEFFKANCDENLHQYVQSRSKSQQILLLEQKLRIKDFENARLAREIQFLSTQQKHTDARLRNKLGSNSDVSDQISVPSNLTCKNEIDSGPLYEGWEPDEYKKLMIENHILYEAAREDAKIMENEEINYFNGLQEIRDDSFETYLLSPYINWYLMLLIIKEKINNLEFCSNLALLIPESFSNQILSHDIDSTTLTMPSFRTLFEFVASKFTYYKTENEAEFKQVLDIRAELINASRKRRGKAEIIELMKGFKVDDAFLKHSMLSVKINNLIPTQLCNSIDMPFDIGFLCFDKNEINRAVDQLFEEYFRFRDLGLSFSISYDELCSLQNPPISLAALKDEAMLNRLLSVIETRADEMCERNGFHNPIKQIISHEDYPNFIQNSQQRIANTWTGRFNNKNKTS